MHPFGLVQDPGLDIVLPHLGKNVQNSFPQVFLQNREEGFHPPVQVPPHHVGAGQVDFFLAVIVEVVDPAVFQEAAND